MRVLLILLYTICQLNIGLAQSKYIIHGEVLVDLIIDDLQRFENGSQEQDSAIQLVMADLVLAMRTDSLIKYSTEKKNDLFSVGRNLQGRYGPFSILRPERKPNGWIEDWHQDSISLEVLELQRISESLLDSLEQLRKKCEKIIYNQSESPSTRTIALNTLRQVFSPSEYANPFFEEYSNMSWGLLEDINEPECLSCDRDLLSGWYVGTFNIEKWNEDPIFRNWNLIPVIIEYWGDPLWNQSNTNHYTGTMLEQMIFKQLLQGYDRSDLLLEFIQANVQDPNTIILKKLKEDLD